MQLTIAVALSCCITLAAASLQPELQWDPDTISTCVEWFNNGGSDTCEHIRSMFNISPEDFHKWNPSVGIDCALWRRQSYCILTEERLASLTSAVTTSSTTARVTTATTSSTPAPSPASWNALGCYIDESTEYPVLEEQIIRDDPALQIEKCQGMCWKASNSTVFYAGVKEGNQCWCGSFVGGQTSRNQSDCDIPCSGNEQEICGGKERINVFEPVLIPTTSLKTPTNTAASTAMQSFRARKNHALF